MSGLTLFPRYDEYDPLVPVWCVTPGTGRVIHRFFDTSPFSPSGRYLALTRIPAEDRLPVPGDVAQVVLVDLDDGTERVVAETRGWDTQLGAQVQWGATDGQLFFNDVDLQTWRPYGVIMDPVTGSRRNLEGTVYAVSPNGRWVASPSLVRMRITQAGYGVHVPPHKVTGNHGASSTDGIYVTDTESGRCHLLSLRDIVERGGSAIEQPSDRRGDFYGWHVKWNSQGDRLMFVLHCRLSEHEVRRNRIARVGSRLLGMLKRRPDRQRCVITLKPDGSDVCVAIPDSAWRHGGHHPTWCPDGKSLTSNIYYRGRGMRFVQVRYDGSGLRVLTDAVPGSGHPTLHPNGRHILSDAYLDESFAFDDGSVPIRLIDLETESERMIVRMRTRPAFEGPTSELRVDPHPAWDRQFRRIAFNGCSDGTRRVFVADLTHILSQE